MGIVDRYRPSLMVASAFRLDRHALAGTHGHGESGNFRLQLPLRQLPSAIS